MSEYIKIADFASRKGISKQEAYKIANAPQNKEYIRIENGIKYISSFLLDDKSRENKDSRKETKKQEQSQPADTKEIEYLKEQIRELQAQIKKKDEQIAEFTLKFAELAQQSNTIASQAQVLHAIDKQKKPNFFQKLLGKGKE